MKTITIDTRNPNFEKYFNIKNNRTALIKPELFQNIPDQLFPFTEKFKYHKKYLEPNKIKYVLGPCSYTEFTYDGRNFYIFGETHNNNFNNNSINCGQDMNDNNTVMFSILVRSLAKFYLDNNIDRTIDLNIEFGLLETVDKAGNNIFRKRFSPEDILNLNSKSIQSILVEFDNFINTTKKYKHDDDLKQKLRLQLVDYRRTVLPNIDSQESGYEDIKKKIGIPDYFTSPILKNKVQIQPINLDKETLEKIKLFIKTYITNSEKIQKQLKSIEDQILQDIIMETIMESIDKNVSDLGSSGILGKIINLITINYFGNPNLPIILALVFMSIMDIYAICRIFRKFNPLRENISSPYFKGTATDIFYYCGNFHAQTFKYLLEEIKKNDELNKKLKIRQNIDNCPSKIGLFMSQFTGKYTSCLKLDISKTNMIPKEIKNNTVIEIPYNNSNTYI